jgi:WD40 repeat protein
VDVSTGQELRSFTGHSVNVTSVAFSPEGRFAVSGGDDNTLKLWDVSEWTAPQSAQPAPLAQAAKPARQDTETSGTVFKPIIKKD